MMQVAATAGSFLAAWAAAALPPTTMDVLSRTELWALQGDGRTCDRIDPATRAMLADWLVDDNQTISEEGIFGLYNPSAPNQLAVVFESATTCRRVVGALRATQDLPPQVAWGAQQRGVSLGLGVEKSTWRVNEAPWLTVLIRNHTKKAVTIEEPRVTRHANTTVFWNDRRLRYEGPKGKLWAGGKPPKVTIAAGDTHLVELRLEPLFMATRIPAGKHQVYIVLGKRTSGRLTLRFRG